MADLATWLQTIGTTAAAGAAVLSWRASRRANDASQSLTDIERERQHRELCPQFTSNLTALNLGGHDGYLRLVVGFEAPPGLEEISALTLTIRNDRPDRDVLEQPRVGLTQQDVANQVWGPAEFTAAPSGGKVAPHGRSVRVNHRLLVGEAFMFEMRWTRAPHWYGGPAPLHMWIQDMRGPIKIVIEAEHARFDRPWRIPVTIELDRILAGYRATWMDQEEPISQIPWDT